MVNEMRISALISVVLILSLFLKGSGCTKIESPVRPNPDDATAEDLSITIEKHEILDSEPVRVRAHGGVGNITWKTDPLFVNCFHPETGNQVLFTPPDIVQDMVIVIVAVILVATCLLKRRQTVPK